MNIPLWEGCILWTSACEISYLTRICRSDFLVAYLLNHITRNYFFGHSCSDQFVTWMSVIGIRYRCLFQESCLVTQNLAPFVLPPSVSDLHQAKVTMHSSPDMLVDPRKRSMIPLDPTAKLDAWSPGSLFKHLGLIANHKDIATKNIAGSMIPYDPTI